MLISILRAESSGDAMIGGFVVWIVIIIVIALFRGAKKVIKGKTFEEGDKNN